MRKLRIVTCTTHDKESFADSPLSISLSRMKLEELDIEIHAFYSNRLGLSVCYNSVLDLWKGDDCMIVFMHDDCFLVDNMVSEKLESAFMKFNIVGVAGSSDFNIKRLPVTWINSPKDSWSGFVLHSNTDNAMNPYDVRINYYGPPGRKCAVIDGVFMGIDNLKIGNVRFNEEFMFDFYDSSFCMEALKAGLTIGTAPIIVSHCSHGKGVSTEKYNETQKKFIEKYAKEKV